MNAGWNAILGDLLDAPCRKCGRTIERGAAIDYTGARYHPRCVVALLMAHPAYVERQWRLGRRLVIFTDP